MNIEMRMEGFPNIINLEGDKVDGKSILRPNEVNINLQGDNYFIGVDPSSSTTGLLILNLDTGIPEVNLNLDRRVLSNGKKQDGDSLLDNVITFLSNLIYCNPNKIKYACTERAYEGNKNSKGRRYSQSFYKAALLASGYSRINSLFRNNDIPNFCTSAPEWKTWFLKYHPMYGRFNVTESNKEYIKDVASLFFPAMAKMKKQDAFDAFGIGHFWYNNHWNYLKQGIINVTPSMDRNYNYKISAYIRKLTDIPNCQDLDNTGLPRAYTLEEFKDFLDVRKNLIISGSGNVNTKCKVMQYNYCTRLSLHENFQALQYLMPDNVFYAIVPVCEILMPELVPYRDNLGTLNLGDKLLIACYPARI